MGCFLQWHEGKPGNASAGLSQLTLNTTHLSVPTWTLHVPPSYLWLTRVFLPPSSSGFGFVLPLPCTHPWCLTPPPPPPSHLSLSLSLLTSPSLALFSPLSLSLPLFSRPPPPLISPPLSRSFLAALSLSLPPPPPSSPFLFPLLHVCPIFRAFLFPCPHCQLCKSIQLIVFCTCDENLATYSLFIAFSTLPVVCFADGGNIGVRNERKRWQMAQPLPSHL